MTRWANRILFVLNMAFLLVIVACFGWRGVSHVDASWKYSDFISVTLTALAVILAAVTLFIAVLAVWGYTSLREAAERVARAVARDTSQSVAAREAREAVGLYIRDSVGQSPFDSSDDELVAALKEGGDGHELGFKP